MIGLIYFWRRFYFILFWISPGQVMAGSDLLSLYDVMLASSPQVKIAESGIKKGEYERDEAFSRLLPQLELGSTINHTHYSNETVESRYNGERYFATVTQVLFDRTVWLGYERALALGQQYSADADDQTETLTISLLQHYFGVLIAEDRLSLTQAEHLLVSRSLSRITALLERQLASVTDKLVLQARSDELAAQLLEHENQVALTKNALGELIGQEIKGNLLGLPLDASRLTAVELEDIATLEQRVVTNNRRLSAQRAAVAAAEAELKMSYSGHYPTVSLSASHQQSNIGYDNAQSNSSDSQVVALNIKVPIYQGGAVVAREGAAYQQLIIEQQKLEQLRREINRELQEAYLNTYSYHARINAGLAAMTSAEASRLAVEKGLGYGIKSAVDLLESMKEEFSARNRYFEAQYNFLLSYALAKKWSGELGLGVIKDINSMLDRP